MTPGEGADDALHFQAHEGDIDSAGHEAGAGDEVVDVALFMVDGVEEDLFIQGMVTMGLGASSGGAEMPDIPSLNAFTHRIAVA